MNESAFTWSEFVANWTDVFRDPVLCGAIGGTVLGFLGVYVVLKRMVFVSAAITTSAGLGVAFAFYLAIHHAIAIGPSVSAAIFAVVTTLIFLAEPSKLRVTREGLLGLVFALAGGLTLLIESRISQEAHDIHAILFGDAVLVSTGDLWTIAAIGAMLLTVHILGFRGITFAAFDRDTASVQGLPVTWVNSYILIGVGVMVGVCAQALGALPVFALTTLPGIGAVALGLPLRHTFALAAALGGMSGAGGYLVAAFRDYPVGGAQTVLAGVIAIGCLAGAAIAREWARRRG